MSKQASTPYLALAKTAVTFFDWQNEKHNVRTAPANVFDAWIRQYVEEIINVDIAIWDKFQRWQIINAVLSGRFLVLSEESDGTYSLRGKSEAEEESSAPIEKEAQASTAASMINIAGAPIISGWTNIVKGTLEERGNPCKP